MNLLQQFIDYLINQKHKPSFLTVKNYKADIGQFIGWFEKVFNFSFDPSKITKQTLEQYKKSRNLSPISIKRHVSSLRKFFHFLKLEGIISADILKKKTTSAQAQALEDPWKLKNFKNFLYEYKKSNLTIKNYINDMKSFFAWLSEVSLTKYAWNIEERNLLDKVNFSVINEYKQRLIASKFSPRTINRKLSSMRNYITWAKSQGLISENSKPRQTRSEYLGNQNIRKSEHQEIRPSESLKFRSSGSPSFPSIPNYSSFPPLRLIQESINGANFLFDNLLILPLAQAIENTGYLFWKASGKKIFKKNIISNSSAFLQNKQAFEAVSPQPESVQDDKILNIKKEFYAPLNVSLHYLPRHKRMWHYFRHVRPNWYRTYHSYSFTHYFHFAILIILASAIGFGTYNGLFADAQRRSSTLAATSFASPRILSFQGKLTDSSNNPIATTTNILFSIYNDDKASENTFLWQERNLVQPDSDGIFSVFLGKNNPIPDTLFSQNAKLFLGITVGNSPELSPRQQLATVPFASNSQTLQGLEPITNTTKVSNVVLALDSSGNLSIAGSKAHTFQAIGGQFVLSGSVLSLTTIPGSNSRVEIVPDGIGKIDLSKPIQNSTDNNNLSSAIGAVEFDDVVAILATSSAQSAFYINQDSAGPLITASTSGIAKFTVGNDGSGTFAGSVDINGSSLTSTATTFNLLNSTVTTLNLGGAATNLVLGASTGTITIRNASTSIQGNVTLGDATTDTLTFTGRVAQDSSLIPITTSGTNSLGSSSLPWDNAYINNIYSASTGTFGHWQRANGGLSPTNISDDILIGAIATSSALIKLSGTSGNNSWINTGNVGIGTTAPSFILDVRGNQASTASAQIFNTNTGTDADGLIVKLGNTSTTVVSNTNHFISFETSGIGIVGSVQGNGGTGVTYATSGIADFAEYFNKDANQTIEYGAVVCLSVNGLAVPCDNNSNKIIGVASERPAFLGGENLGDRSIAVGLVGLVETFVSTASGEVLSGDALTASDIPGVAVKATKAGQIIGKALEDLDTIDESKAIGFYDPDNKEYRSKANFPNISIKPNIIRIFKIYVLVNVSWHDPGAYLANTGDLEIVSSNKYQVASIENKVSENSRILNTYYLIHNTSKELIEKAGAFTELAVANLRTGLINASEVITKSLIVTSDSIIVNGQNLKDYIASVVDELGIISPVVRTVQLSTDIISPLSSGSTITVAGKLVILSETKDLDSSQASPDQNDIALEVKGNASFSGSLTSENLGVNNDASISGILRARSIIADSIQGFIDIASFSAQLAYVPNLQAEQGLFNQGLMVFGGTSLSDLSIAGNLSIGGTLFITENSIETLGADLSFQSLRQGGLSIMGDLVYIDTDGNLKVKGDVSILGKLAVNVISPLPASDLVINNASGSSVLSINQKGDLIASGSGTFAKLNLSLAQPALAVSATELIASSSAGVAQINPNKTEMTIKNTLVTEKSLIYITPVGTPSAQSPFLIRQVPSEAFTVGVESPTRNPIPFNWLIVN